MSEVVDSPFAVFGMFLVAQWTAAYLGDFARGLRRPAGKDDHEDFDLVQTAILTLLALIVGFSFSMAISRYDQRKGYEEEEANAIGTEYIRADLLPAADAAKVREQLKEYLQLRILFYETRDNEELEKINNRTASLQADLWSTIKAPTTAQQTPVIGLVVSGMHDVFNSQGYAQAAWWNRIPKAAWALMMLIAIFLQHADGLQRAPSESGDRTSGGAAAGAFHRA